MVRIRWKIESTNNTFYPNTAKICGNIRSREYPIHLVVAYFTADDSIPVTPVADISGCWQIRITFGSGGSGDSL